VASDAGSAFPEWSDHSGHLAVFHAQSACAALTRGLARSARG